MNTTSASQDTVVIGRLLAELLTRMDGLLDTGTSAVLAGILPDPRAFIEERCEVLRCLVVVLRALLPASSAQTAGRSLDQLLAACGRLRANLIELATHRPAPGEGSTVVDQLPSIVSEITSLTAALAAETGVALACSTERRSYRERIFQNLQSVLAGTVPPRA